MSKKFRRFLFWLIFFLFILVSLVLVIISFGYRFDWENSRIVQTSGLFLKFSPRDSKVYLNGKILEKKPNLLTGGIYLQNLLPKRYSLTIEKAGYFPWRKTISLEPNFVEYFTQIFLLPEKPFEEEIYQKENSTTTLEEILDFYPLKNQEGLILEVKEQKGRNNYLVLKFFDLKKKETQEIFRKKLLGKENLALLKNLEVSSQESKFLISYFDQQLKQKVFYLWEKNNPQEILDLSSLLKNYLKRPIQKVIFHPYEDNKFIFATPSQLGLLDLDKKEVSYFSAVNPLDFFAQRYYLFWIDKGGAIFSYNFILKETTPLGILELEEGENLAIKRFQSSFNARHLLLELANGELFLISPNQPIKLLEKNNQVAEFSPDSKKLAYGKKGELKILFLEDLFQDIIKKAGEEIRINFDQEDFQKIFWWSDSFHFLVQGEKIYFSEIDDRGEINSFVYDFSKANYYFSNNYLYQLNSQGIKRIDLKIKSLEG